MMPLLRADRRHRLSSCSTPPFRPVRLARSALLAVALLVGLAPVAWAQGTVSGRVTSTATGLGLPDSAVQFYDLNDGDGRPLVSATTDALGDYTANLPASTYAVLTQDTHGHINRIYNNLPCSATCDVNAMTPLVIGNGTVFNNIDFALAPGGRMAGTVTDSATGLPIANVHVYFIDENASIIFTGAVTDAGGHYLSEGGTVTGSVYAVTENSLGYRDEAFDNIFCGDCDPSEFGTLIPVTVGVTTGGIDFALDPAGSIAGIVTGAGGAPLANVGLKFFDSTGEHVTETVTDGAGAFRSAGLPTGTYYAATRNALGLVDKLYNNVICPHGNCDTVGRGTTISVTSPSITGGINFTLAPGGTITGTVTNAAGAAPIEEAAVDIFDPTGAYLTSAFTNQLGTYVTGALPAGTYYAWVLNTPGFQNQLYNHLPCTPNCNIVATGTPITVATGAATANINFALNATTAVGTISGTVTDTSTGLPVSGLQVQLFSSTGANLTNMNTNGTGVYTFAGLAVGSYYVRTNTGGALINQLHNGVTCIQCAVTTSGGTPVSVTSGLTTTINFALTPGGRISGTITNAAGGAAISGVGAQLFSAAGVTMGTYNSNAQGLYTTPGLPAGTYYVRTTNSLGFVNELYDNVSCPGTSCSVTTGAPIVIVGAANTPSKDFALAQGGRISGTVTSTAGGGTISGLTIQTFTAIGGSLGTVNTDGSGNYITSGLPAGTYYIRTANGLGFVDELYDNIPCVPICLATTGTPIAVTVGTTQTGKNFAVTPGGAIAGTVTDAVTTGPLTSVTVVAYTAAGVQAKTAGVNANGVFVISGLPAGTYYARTSVQGGQFYLDELYDELPCAPACTVTDGTPIVVTAGATQNGKSFTLSPGGGAFAGTVRDAGTAALLGGMPVQAYLANGTLAKSAVSNASGVFTISGLPAGSYYARTATTTNYVDELYNDRPCFPSCTVTTGDAIVVADGATAAGKDFSVAPSLLLNGRFDNGTTTGWSPFATPTNANIVSNVTNGVFQFYRVPQPGQSNEAEILQSTGLPLATGTALEARFDLGNSDNVRKRFKVLVHDLDFTDSLSCTFFLDANAPLRSFVMRTHTTKAWINASMTFYASTAGSNGGFYQVDNVSLQVVPAGTIDRTECVDPQVPTPPGGVDGPDLIVNGGFGSGALLPGWSLDGQIVQQITGTVFQFRRGAATPAGVVLQPTGLAMVDNQILTATLQLGNSSGVRKRVKVLIHDLDFTDAPSCVFWIPAGQGLLTYTMRVYATKPWANATISVYPSTSGLDEWTLLDNVTLARTPGIATVGTSCFEPGAGARAALPAAARPTATPDATPAAEAPDTLDPTLDAVSGWLPSSTGDFVVSPDALWTETGTGWMAEATTTEPAILRRADAIDLRAATSATLTFQSWLQTLGSRGEVQVSTNGVDWVTVSVVPASATWVPIDVDLGEFLGEILEVQFVFHGVAPPDGSDPDVWRVDDIQVSQ